MPLARGIRFNWRGDDTQSWSPTQTVCVPCVPHSKCYVPGTRASERSPVPSAMPVDAMRAYVEHAVRRFAPCEPIFFVSGDTAWDSDQEPVYCGAALEIAREHAPGSLLTMHMVPSATLPDEFVERVDLYICQSGHGAEQTTP